MRERESVCAVENKSRNAGWMRAYVERKNNMNRPRDGGENIATLLVVKEHDAITIVDDWGEGLVLLFVLCAGNCQPLACHGAFASHGGRVCTHKKERQKERGRVSVCE